jgi:hypothetical protein
VDSPHLIEKWEDCVRKQTMNLVKSKLDIIGGGTRPTINVVTRGGIYTNDHGPVNIQKIEGAPKFDEMQ